MNLAQGQIAKGPVWPMLFILIACGAVSGFHSLCGGGTTCKQLTSESASRRIGYYGMLLESFLAVCVIAVLMIGAQKGHYIADVHPGLLEAGAKGNWVLGFAMAVGNTAAIAFGVPIAAGALAGMVLLEGFLVTTLDTAIRLTRYLIEEVWRTVFASYDVFAEPVGEQVADNWAGGEGGPAGVDGVPVTTDPSHSIPAPVATIQTSGIARAALKLLRTYWFNSGLAVAIMLALALTGGVTALWNIFATSNQLLAAIVLGLAAIWLYRRGKKLWYALIPAVFMFATTLTSLGMLLKTYLANPSKFATLLAADVVLFVIAIYLIVAGVREVVRFRSSAGD